MLLSRAVSQLHRGACVVAAKFTISSLREGVFELATSGGFFVCIFTAIKMGNEERLQEASLVMQGGWACIDVKTIFMAK